MSAHSFFIANSWKYIPLSALFYHGTVYFVRILLILLYTLKSQCFPGGPLLGHPWTISGPLLGHPWTISGPLLGHPWTISGPPINFHSFHTLKFQHFPGGPPLGHCWATSGPLLGHPWATHKTPKCIYALKFQHLSWWSTTGPLVMDMYS